MGTHVEVEREHMEDDHREERDRTDEDRERDESEGRERVERLGEGAAERAQLARFVDDIAQSSRASEAVNQGTQAQDMVELSEVLGEHGGEGDGRASRGARERVDVEAREPLDASRNKRWYARWKFWAFLGGTVGTMSAMIFSGLALRQGQPDDPDYEEAMAARRRLEKWRGLPDRDFWQEVAHYVGNQRFSLETQAHLMHQVELVFPSQFVPLRDGEAQRLADELCQVYRTRVGQGPEMPSLAIYWRLAEGLSGLAQDGRTRTLPRAQCADIALIALMLIRQAREG